MNENLDNKQKYKAKDVKDAIRVFTGENNTDSAVEFLRNNPDQAGEFCLEMMDVYQPTDRSTPFLMLGQIMEKLARS